ncbi:Mariner Mos1 transposase [Eumeta japonica]|uniref:Mariner Mos1 transposase n=1 Tax=Eumeta variegata TaxID=151549 RepID=A0A4C1TJB5_EUMVA|nr:Mariner Mos1 transposase [Eumeta japonica]
MSKFELNKRHIRELLIYFFNLKKSADKAHQLFVEAYNEAALSERTSVPVKNCLKTPDWEVLPHPPYSPDIALSDYHLFRSMAYALSEQRFTSYEDIKN